MTSTQQKFGGAILYDDDVRQRFPSSDTIANVFVVRGATVLT